MEIRKDHPWWKLSRQDQLLMLIDERSAGSSGEDGAYWIPGRLSEYVAWANGWTAIGGGGDRSALKALVRKGLVREMRPPGQELSRQPLGYRVTEEGRLRAQSIG